jgi:hypothetical protein
MPWRRVTLTTLRRRRAARRAAGLVAAFPREDFLDLMAALLDVAMIGILFVGAAEHFFRLVSPP